MKKWEDWDVGNKRKEIIMKKILCLFFLLIVSCGPGPDELFETAELEVLQTNYPHATRLYLEIIGPEELFEPAGRNRKEDGK